MAEDLIRAARARILVVDDDVAIGGTIKRYLRQFDVEVSDCVEGAITQLGGNTYDLLLLDRRLPDGLGDSVVEHVRSRKSSMPILMMSGEIDPRSFDQGTRRVDDFIEKPFVKEALVGKIEHLLASHALRSQAARQRAELAELHQRRDREIDVARGIFDRIFARGQFDADRVRRRVLAADRLAGDVVFAAWSGGGRYRWMIGDVTGHTLSSALVTMSLAGIFYRSIEERRVMRQVLEGIERELCAILPASMFCAGAMCELDRDAGQLEVWNGGNPDLLIRHVSGEVTRIPSIAMPLAADLFSLTSYPTAIHDVVAGDRIFAFSDGLMELRDDDGAMLGFDRLLEIASTGSAETVFDRLLACIPETPGPGGRDDDISLIEVVV